jgi:hypothetical protein
MTEFQRTKVALAAALILAIVGTAVEAKPVAIASRDGITITLYDEPCALKTVSNLPQRATWTEGGKRFEGCFTVRPDAGAVVAYFDDGSVVMFPIRAFGAAREI